MVANFSIASHFLLLFLHHPLPDNMLPTLPCVVAFLVIALTYWIYKWRNPSCKGTLPPGSMGWPLIGESIQFFIPSKSLDIPHFVKKRTNRYGPIFKTSLAGRSVIVSSDPELNQFLLHQEGKAVEFWMMDTYAKLIGHKGSVKDGSSNMSGQYHRYYRKMLLDQFGPDMLREKLLADMEKVSIKKLKSWSTKDFVELKQESSEMIFEFVAKYLFSYDSENCKLRLWEKFSDFPAAFVSFPISIPGTRYHRCMKNHKEIIDFLKNTIKERREMPGTQKGDCIDQAIEDMKTLSFLSDEYIAYVIFGFLLAGFETVSSALTFGVIMLAENPTVLEELAKENDEIVRNRENMKSGLTWKEYRSMKFTMQVINELLRMAGAAPALLRRALTDIDFKGYRIPKDWVIMLSLTCTHLDPNKFEDPLVFNPWRWKDSLTNKSFMPFGGGIKACPGAELTKVTIAVFLHVLVSQYRWTRVEGGEIIRKSLVLGFGEGYFININSAKSSNEEH